MKNSDAMPARRSPWPGIVAVAIAALLFGSLWYKTREPAPALQPVASASEESGLPASTLPARAAPPPAVAAFLAFAEGPAPEVLPLGHEYTAEGLRRLAAALAASGETGSTQEQARSVSQAADDLARDPRSLRHAAIARRAFIAAARALGSSRVERAAQALSVDEPMRSQKARVERFFDEAAAALAAQPHASAA